MGQLVSRIRRGLKEKFNFFQAEYETHSNFEEILQNPGLHLIGRRIFSFLDYDDLASCRLICRGANDLIKHQRFWLTSLLKSILHTTRTFWYWRPILPKLQEDPWKFAVQEQSEKSIIEAFPWWQTYYEYIIAKANWCQLELIIYVLLQGYFRTTNLGMHSDPLGMEGEDCPPLCWMFAKKQLHSNLKLLEFFLDSPLRFMDDFLDRNESSPLYKEVNRNPFARACRQGYVEKAKLILKYAKKQSIDLTEITPQGNALHVACSNAQVDAVKFLLQHRHEIGLDVNSIDELLGTALHAVLRMEGRCSESLGRRKEIVTYFLEKRFEYGINANHRFISVWTDDESMTPVELAFENNLMEIVDVFKQHGFGLD